MDDPGTQPPSVQSLAPEQNAARTALAKILALSLAGKPAGAVMPQAALAPLPVPR